VCSSDLNDFLGLGVLGGGQHIERDVFRLSAAHRYVRHPWYSFGLVIVWTRDMNAAMLVSALAITIYFVVGSRLEERKLIEIHGDTYRRYRSRLPQRPDRARERDDELLSDDTHQRLQRARDRRPAAGRL
jgi:hypothetical protein